MEIIILSTPDKVNREVSSRIIRLIKTKPDAVLGLATGRTMEGIYQRLVREYQQSRIDFSRASSFNLDEYIGVDRNDPVTFFSYMHRHLFDQVNFSEENIHIPSSLPDDIDSECSRYEKSIRSKGGIDLQLLGIGREGHIGFNEPSSSLTARTRIKTLTAVTLRDNFPEGQGPRFALTMGIGTIMEAREIILTALGKNKAEVVAAAVEGPITASCPASVLQFHPKAKIILDGEASSLLKRKEYYQWVWRHKAEAEAIGKKPKKSGSIKK